MLGVLPGENNGEIDWACILPLQQPAHGEGVFTGMNAPFAEGWHTLDELDAGSLAPNMRFVVQHLEHDGTAVGFNYSQDPRTRVINGEEVPKLKPNSWDHFHMHWVRGMNQMIEEVGAADTVAIQAGPRTIDVRPHRYLSEMLSPVVENSLRHAYRNHTPSGAATLDAIVSKEEKQKLPFVSEGGLTFSFLAAEYDEVGLGTAIKSVHESYLEVHEKIWQLFVANYGEVSESKWELPYELRSSDEVEEGLKIFTADETLQRGMKRYFGALRPESEVSDSMNWLYKGPSYSMALYKHESDYIVSLLPHLMHPTNWLSALGMFEARQNSADDFTKQRGQAKLHMQKIGSGALVWAGDLV
jgi:hypothetical protein